jgi:hypothetical protein
MPAPLGSPPLLSSSSSGGTYGILPPPPPGNTAAASGSFGRAWHIWLIILGVYQEYIRGVAGVFGVCRSV